MHKPLFRLKAAPSTSCPRPLPSRLCPGTVLKRKIYPFSFALSHHHNNNSNNNTMKIRLAWRLLAVSLSLISATSSASSNKPNNPFLSPSLEVEKQPLLASILDVDESLLNCKPTGLINDARCDYETVERDINTSNFFQTLSNLVKEKYFRFYKVDLYKDCPFWNENSLCMSQDCTVSKVDEVSKHW